MPVYRIHGVYAPMKIVVFRVRKTEREIEALACYTSTPTPYNVWNIKVRLTGCLSSNYSLP